MFVSDLVKNSMEQRLSQSLELIKQYQIKYKEIGIFGSYARGDYKSTSDIDICVLVEERPNMRISGSLREELDEFGVDLVWVTPDVFKSSTSNFMNQLRRDYRRVL